MNPCTTSLLVLLALVVAPVALRAQTPSISNGIRASQDDEPTTGATARPPARFSAPTSSARLVPRTPSLAADSVDQNRNAGWYALGGAVVGALVVIPWAYLEAASVKEDCMYPCAGPAIVGIELLGAGLGAVGGLIVRKIVQH